jgi:hypothetical protein
MSKEEAKDKLIEVLMNQVVDLTMMSKIELGDDVIEEIKRLKEIINQNEIEMTYKTLIKNKGTEYQEFYGFISGVTDDWATSSTPINLMNKNITWEDLKRMYPNKDFHNIDLVTIEIKIIQ